MIALSMYVTQGACLVGGALCMFFNAVPRKGSAPMWAVALSGIILAPILSTQAAPLILGWMGL